MALLKSLLALLLRTSGALLRVLEKSVPSWGKESGRGSAGWTVDNENWCLSGKGDGRLRCGGGSEEGGAGVGGSLLLLAVCACSLRSKGLMS
jgi:hypothetical protein